MIPLPRRTQPHPLAALLQRNHFSTSGRLWETSEGGSNLGRYHLVKRDLRTAPVGEETGVLVLPGLTLDPPIAKIRPLTTAAVVTPSSRRIGAVRLQGPDLLVDTTEVSTKISTSSVAGMIFTYSISPSLLLSSTVCLNAGLCCFDSHRL